MNALRKNLNTPKTAYCDFFQDRPYLPTLPSHNILNNKYLPPHRPPTTQTVARCGDNVIADIDNATGTVVRTYVTPGIDANVSMTDHTGATAVTNYYNADERSSVMNLTDSTGAVVQSYGYSAYGDKVDALTSGTVEQRYTYTGRELSAVSSDYYFRYRWYGAASGSFITRDPLGYEADGTAIYLGYFATMLARDPEGLVCCCCPKSLEFSYKGWTPKAGGSYQDYVDLFGKKQSEEDWLRDSYGDTIGYFLEMKGVVDYRNLNQEKGKPLDCTYENYEQTNIPNVWTPGMGITKSNVWVHMNKSWNLFPLTDKVVNGKDYTFPDSDAPRANVVKIGKGKKLILQFYNVIRNKTPKQCKQACGGKTETTLCGELVLSVDNLGKADYRNSSFRVVKNCKGFSKWPNRDEKLP